MHFQRQPVRICHQECSVIWGESLPSAGPQLPIYIERGNAGNGNRQEKTLFSVRDSSDFLTLLLGGGRGWLRVSFLGKAGRGFLVRQLPKRTPGCGLREGTFGEQQRNRVCQEADNPGEGACE